MKKCEICEEQQSKYKCPKCEIPYCSVACYKSHKNNEEHCQILAKTKKCQENKSQGETETSTVLPTGKQRSSHTEELEDDKINPELLEKLGQSSHLRSMLHNQHLQELINRIDSSTNPDKDLKEAMKLPLFTDFVDECLNIVEPNDIQPELPELKPEQIIEAIVSN